MNTTLPSADRLRSECLQSVRLPFVASFILGFLLSLSVAWSADVTWSSAGSSTPGGTGNWTGGSTWWNGASAVSWTAGDNATFSAAGNTTVNIDVTAGTLTFSNGTSNISILDGAGSLRVNSSITATNTANTAALTYTISESSLILGANQTWTVNNGGNVGTANLAVSSAISGSGLGITKAGNGTLTLSGSNTFDGNLTITSGTLSATSGIAALGNGTALTLNQSTRLNITPTSGSNSTSRQLVLTGTSGFSLAAYGSDALTWSGNLVNQATTNAHALNLTGTSTANNTFSGVLSDNGSNTLRLTKAETGTWVLTGNNTFSGNVDIGEGKLVVSTIGNSTETSNLGKGSLIRMGGNTENGTATLEYVGTGNTSNKQFSVSSTSNTRNDTIQILNNGSGALVFSSGNFLAAASLSNSTATKTLVFGGSNTNNNTISGNISNGNGTTNSTITLSLTKTGTGLWILSGNNTYTGTTTLSAGTLQMGHANAFGTTGNITFGGGALQYGSGITADLSSRIKNSASAILVDTNSNNVTFASALDSTNSGGLTKNGSGILKLSGNNTYTGATTINAGVLEVDTTGLLGGGSYSGNIANSGTLIIGSSSSQTLSGIISGTGALTKNGSGTLTLSGNNTYSGATTVNAGTLAVSGNMALSAITLNTGAVVSAGTTAAVAKFNAAALTVGAGTGYAFTIGNVAASVAGTDYDQIALSGALTLNNTSANPLSVSLYGTPTAWSGSSTYTWDMITAASVTGFTAGNFTTDFTNFGISAALRGGNWTFSNPTAGNIRLTYTGVGGGNVTWSGGTGNWTSGFSPAIAEASNITYNGTGGGISTNNISSGTIVSVGNITFSSGAGAYTLAANSGSAGFDAANPLTVTGNIVNNSTNTQTINTALAFGTTRTIDTASGAMAIGGAISGPGGLTKNGTNTLTLSGANTFSGNVTVSSGTLSVNSVSDSAANALGTGTQLALGQGASFLYNGSTTANTTRSLILTGSTGGQFILANGAGPLIWRGNINNQLSAASLATIYIRGSSTAANEFAGVISNNGSNALTVVKDLGGKWIFSGNNTFTGTMDAFDGTLSVSTIENSGVASNIGAGSVIRFGGFASQFPVLEYTGNGSTTNRQIKLGGGGTGSTGGSILNNGTGALVFNNAAFNSSGDGTYSNTTRELTLGGTNTGNNTISGVIANNAGTNNTVSLNKTGTGLWILSGNNTYTGGTTITAGTLQIGDGAASGSVSGNIINNADLVFNRSDAVTWSNAISGTGNLTKASGSGTLTLSGANTFNGAVTVSSGTLISTNASGLGNGTQISMGFNTRLDVRVTSGETWTMNQTLAANGSLTMANNQSGVLIWNGNLTNSATSASTVFFSSTGTGTNEFAGVIQNTTNNSAVNLSFQNTQIWKLTGNNTFSGGITIGGGRVIADKLANTGNASSIGTVGVVRFGYFDNATSTFEYVGSGATSNMQIRLGASAGTTNNNASFLHNGSGALVLTNATFTLAGQGGDPAATRVLVLGGNNTADNTIQGIIGNAGTNATIQLVKSDSGKWILSGNNTYTGGTVINTGTLQIGAGGTSGSLNATSTITNNGTLVFNRSDTVTQGTHFNSVIAGTGNLVQSGNGTLILSGANTYTGTTTVNAGTLRLGASNVLADASNLTITGGTFDISTYSDTVGVITMTNGNLIGTSGVLTGSTYNITGGNLTAQLGGGSVIINEGTTNVGTVGSAVTLTVNGSSAVAALTSNVTAQSVSLLNGGSITGSFSLNSTGGVSSNRGSIASSLIGSGGVTMNGTGNTLTLSGSNSYTGATTISAGTISINAAAALGSTSEVSMANGTALLYTGGAGNLTRAISVTSGTGTIQNSGSGLLTLSGGLSKNGTTMTLKGGSNGITVNGAITGSAANSDLILDGGSTTLAAANTYNGPTFLVNGTTLTASVAGALPTGPRTAVTMDATGSGSSTLALGASQSIASLTGAASSNVTLGANTLTIGTTSGSTTFAGRISGSGNLVKDGASTQVLSGTNTFTGSTTVNAGTLQAAASNALGGTTQIVVNNGGSLLVTADSSVNDSAAVTLAGGSLAFSGTVNETFGALTLSANSTLDFGTESVVAIFSSLVMNNNTLSVYNWTGTTLWNGGTGNNTDRFVVNSTLGVSDLSRISFYSGISNSSFVGNGYQIMSGDFANQIIPVPEPETYATAAILLLLGAAYQLHRQRKNKTLKANSLHARV